MELRKYFETLDQFSSAIEENISTTVHDDTNSG